MSVVQVYGVACLERICVMHDIMMLAYVVLVCVLCGYVCDVGMCTVQCLCCRYILYACCVDVYMVRMTS